MSKKIKPDARGFVFSTDPNFRFEEEPEQVQETLLPAQQKLKVRLDTKHRGGKAVTLVENFIGSQEDRDDLGADGCSRAAAENCRHGAKGIGRPIQPNHRAQWERTRSRGHTSERSVHDLDAFRHRQQRPYVVVGEQEGGHVSDESEFGLLAREYGEKVKG